MMGRFVASGARPGLILASARGISSAKTPIVRTNPLHAAALRSSSGGGAGVAAAPTRVDAAPQQQRRRGAGVVVRSAAAAALVAQISAVVPLPPVPVAKAWVLLSLCAAVAAIAEARTAWGAAISSPLLCMAAGAVFAWGGALPTAAAAAAYIPIWAVVMPLASALLVMETRDMSR